MREIKHVLPADIERTSMSIITAELAEKQIVIPEEYRAIVHRCIHTSADFDYAENLRFTPHAPARGIEALANGVIVTDTNMACTGISKPSLKKLNAQAFCFTGEPQIAEIAKANGTTRAVAGMTYAAEQYPKAIFAIGNAPTALLYLAEQIRKGLRPSLVIGVPVGFVNVCESKEELLEACEECGVPAIVAMGRKGGSNVAAAICNALLYTAVDAIDPGKRGWQG